MKTFKTILGASIATLLVLSVAFAQKTDKPWTDWSKKETQKILEDSPWAQTQVETDTSQSFFSPTSAPGVNGAGVTSTTASREAQGATNQAIDIKYRVRFFSARPIREALARQILLQQKLPDEVVERLRNFAELKAENSIIVTVVFESNDQRYGNRVMQAFNSAITATLRNNTYLQRNDGKQLFLEEYVPPGKDGFGARFIFLRFPEQKPFVESNTTELRFVAQFPAGLKIDRRFKIADMNYLGAIEY